MKLAISNIAWNEEDEAGAAALLSKYGVSAIEIAPTKVFADPLNVSDAELGAFVAPWRDRGVEVVAFQSMLFGHPGLQLFADREQRSVMTSVLTGFLELAGRMGVGRLVFGSPKNRVVPEGMSVGQADEIAAAFFRELGEVAQANNTVLCIEPNPTQYQCNYVTDAGAGIDLVKRVDNPGFGLHLDLAGMTLAGDDVAASIREARPILRHFHVSAPQLGPLSEALTDHVGAAEALREIQYGGYASIEMRPNQPVLENVDGALRLAVKHYTR